MDWRVTFYSSKVESETLGFPKGILAKFLHIVEMIEQFGPNLGKPYVAPLEEVCLRFEARDRKV